jgi:hypothetical protein
MFDRFHAAGSMTLTASSVPALFGQSRFAGRYALACHLTGKVPMSVPNEALVERGRLLEPVIVSMLRAEQPTWDVYGLRAYAPHRSIDRFIASPDMEAWRQDEHPPGQLTPNGPPGIVESKVVADLIFEERWQDGPPLDVELQHQAQFACSGATWGAIVALVIGTFRFDLVVYLTAPELKAIALIETAAREFLGMLDAGQLPEPDDHRSSLRALEQVYPNVDPGKILTLQDDDLTEGIKRFDAWEQAKLDRLATEKLEEAAQNWFFVRALDAGEVRLGNDRTVSAKLITRKGYTKQVAAGSYRKWSLERASDKAGEA